MPDIPILVCTPDEPQFDRLPSSVSAIADCGHPVTISFSGAMLALTTPGVVKVCARCVPAGPKRVSVPEVIRNELATLLGKEAADDIVRRVTGGDPR